MTSDSVTFSESQRFRQWWFLLAMAPGPIVAWALLTAWVVTGTPTALDAGTTLLVWALVGVAVPVLLFNMTLHTRVDSTALMFRFAPFHYRPRRISQGNLTGAEVVEYRPLRDFGGWGIRRAIGARLPRGTRGYTVSGHHGVLLTLKHGEPILIGSERADELAAAARTLIGHTV